MTKIVCFTNAIICNTCTGMVGSFRNGSHAFASFYYFKIQMKNRH
ncbi:hypothetical protein FORC88_1864 [Salmonella enterica subsp. enterica serovar Typhimurium]|nr:hypothetical protein FORC88_1864 [Salmonella enterica subsp. enterica serovar Typhimurium]